MSEAQFIPKPGDRTQEEIFRIGEYHDQEYFGPTDPSEPGFVPYDNRPRKKKPAQETIEMLQRLQFTALRIFDENDSEQNGLTTDFGGPIVGTVWRAPNGVEVMIRPVGNIGVDDMFYLYARKEEGGKFVDITGGGGNPMSGVKLGAELKMNKILIYNLTKQDRSVFYFQMKDDGKFPDDLDRT